MATKKRAKKPAKKKKKMLTKSERLRRISDDDLLAFVGRVTKHLSCLEQADVGIAIDEKDWPGFKKLLKLGLRRMRAAERKQRRRTERRG